MTSSHVVRSVPESGLVSQHVDLRDGGADVDDLMVRLVSAPGGRVLARLTAQNENTMLTLGAKVHLTVGRPRSDVQEGDVITGTTWETPDGQQAVEQILASGTATCVFTTERVVVIVFDSHMCSAAALATSFDHTGSGSVIVVSAERTYLREIELWRSFAGRLREATLTGVCRLTMESMTVIDSAGSPTKPGKNEIERALTPFAKEQDDE